MLDPHRLAVQGARPADKVSHPNVGYSKELDVVKSLHQTGKQHVKNNSEIKIVWRKAIDKQGEPLETYLEKENPELMRLKPKATTFDLFNPISREAISAKTLNTLSVSRIRKPENVYGEIEGYINEAMDYQPLKRSDLDPDEIKSKSIYLAVPEWTSPIQWRHLIRAIIYGKDNGVSVVIIRIRE